MSLGGRLAARWERASPAERRDVLYVAGSVALSALIGLGVWLMLERRMPPPAATGAAP